ncbi:unnamed protein product [Euphydryas editha]|uniref:Uncharacterized protein n=1 Tax=Euphydryas editha TaxID=104508 RepID=A0AAU9VAT0_EUPED|nr:unnamed protein product [Euphydryas editha]
MIFLVLLFACSLLIGDADLMDTEECVYNCYHPRDLELKGTDDPVTVNPEHPKRTDERALRGLQTAYVRI